jgi:hypothetical protein
VALALQIDTSDLLKWSRVYEQLPRAMAQKVISRTLNWVGDKARTKQFRAVAQQTSIPYGDVKDSARIDRSRGGRHAYMITSIGEYLSLRSFDPYQARTGVTARVWGERKTYRGAFIVEKLGGHVFKRKTDARLPIQKLYGPAIPREMHRGGAVDAFQDEVERNMAPRLEHEMNRAIEELAGFHGVKNPRRVR